MCTDSEIPIRNNRGTMNLKSYYAQHKQKNVHTITVWNIILIM